MLVELSNEEREVQILFLVQLDITLLSAGISLSVLLGHHVEKELKVVTRDVELGLVEGLNKLHFVDVAISFSISTRKSLLKGDLLAREGNRSNLSKKFCWSLEISILVEGDFLTEVSLNDGDLDDSCEEGVQLVHNHLDFLVSKSEVRVPANNIMEVGNELLAGDKSVEDLQSLRVDSGLTALLEVLNGEPISAHVVGHLLDGLLGPLLDTPEELPLMAHVEILNRLLEFNLSCP